MNIAYVCIDPGIPVFGTKGASVHIQEVVREFRRRGHSVRVYATRRGSDVPGDLADLEVIEFPITVRDVAAREAAQQATSDAVAAALREDRPDLVYERYSLFSTVLAQAGAPGVLEVNAPLIDEQRTHRVLVAQDAAEQALHTQVMAAAATICVSDHVRDWVVQRVPEGRVFTVPNGVNVERISPVPEAKDGAAVVTFVGTLKPWHGVSVLLEAAALATQPWRVRIIGDGPERAALETQAQKLGLTVDFRGAVTPETMPTELAGTAIAVAPYPATDMESEQYFSPLKVYEYLAAGLPVVASRVGQIPPILDGVGCLVEPSNPAELAAAIDALVADPARRAELGTLARQRAVERHSWARVVDRIMQLVREDEAPAKELT